MTHFTYRKKGGGDFFLPGIGASKDGKITFNKKIETTALEIVDDESSQEQIPEEKIENEEN